MKGNLLLTGVTLFLIFVVFFYMPAEQSRINKELLAAHSRMQDAIYKFQDDMEKWKEKMIQPDLTLDCSCGTTAIITKYYEKLTVESYEYGLSMICDSCKYEDRAIEMTLPFELYMSLYHPEVKYDKSDWDTAAFVESQRANFKKNQGVVCMGEVMGVMAHKLNFSHLKLNWWLN